MHQTKHAKSYRRGSIMKRTAIGLLAATALGWGFSQHASAADLRVAPAPAPVLAYNWTGFYLGAHLGWEVGSGSTQTFLDPNGLVPSVTAAAGTTQGAEAGIQGGYNWQFAPTWLAGIEGDISWGGPTMAVPNQPNFVPGSLIQQQSTDWLASVRGRFGYVAFGNWLVYGTGGGAWAKTEYTSILNTALAPTSGTGFTTTKAGWVAGAGVEWLCMPNMMVRLEYLYYGLNNNAVTATGAFTAPGAPLPAVYTWSKYNMQDVRIAASYKF